MGTLVLPCSALKQVTHPGVEVDLIREGSIQVLIPDASLKISSDQKDFRSAQ